MTSLIVKAKGQITLSKNLLRHIGARPGTRLTVEVLPNGKIEISAGRKQGKNSAAIGLSKPTDEEPLPIEEMNDAVAKGGTGEE